MMKGIAATPLIFGEVLFDRFPDGRAVLGGAPFNVAWNLKALQAEPLLVSRVGQDELGKDIIAAMQEWQMDTRALQRDGRHATGTVEVSFQGGEPSYDIAPDKAYDFIASEELPAALPGVGLLYHGSLALRQTLPRQALAHLHRELAAPVFLDVNLRAPWWGRAEVLELVDRAKWVKLNEEELAQIVPEGTDFVDRAQTLFDRSELLCLIVTRAEKGVWFSDRQGQLITAEAPAVPQVVDTVGAGDAFSSVIILGLLLGWEWSVIIERALNFSAGVVGLQGATTTDRTFYNSFTQNWELS